jgi:hypothetical protein
MQRRVPSTVKLKSLVGDAPKLQLETILRDVIEDVARRIASDNTVAFTKKKAA